ncbi:hypothetical protein ACSS6W_009635 [Trichoderma asperelloides]
MLNPGWAPKSPRAQPIATLPSPQPRPMRASTTVASRPIKPSQRQKEESARWIR